MKTLILTAILTVTALSGIVVASHQAAAACYCKNACPCNSKRG
jgi:hypothetical protein